jgi:hypothetical protein
MLESSHVSALRIISGFDDQLMNSTPLATVMKNGHAHHAPNKTIRLL